MPALVPFSSRRKRLSLITRVSVLLIAAVVLPLLITVAGSEMILRPTLLAQATAEMGDDAQTHVQAIDSLFIARLQDLGFLGQFFAIQRFLSGEKMYRQQALNELDLGYHLDANYSAWTLFDPHGKALLSYPALPGPRGEYMIPPVIMAQLQSGHRTLISDVYFDDNTRMAFLDIYTSIRSPRAAFLGIARSTLKLNQVWTTVNNETNAAAGSYAMIIDGHGVRIAYTNTDTTLTTLPPELFKAIAPLPAGFRQRIKDENLYGNNHAVVTTISDPALASQQENRQGSSTFQLTPGLQREVFQAYQVRCHVVPWTYIVFRPLNTITGAANQQEIYLLLLAAAITMLAAIVGLIVGHSITQPIQHSVSALTKSSWMLQTFAAHEETIASEQKWMVDSLRTGIGAVQYYTRANSVAVHKLAVIGQELIHNWDRLDTKQKKQQVIKIITTAGHIKRAIYHQEHSNKRLSTAIRITSQVTEQLLVGVISASYAIAQLEEVIKQLRKVVGE